MKISISKPALTVSKTSFALGFVASPAIAFVTWQLFRLYQARQALRHYKEMIHASDNLGGTISAHAPEKLPSPTTQEKKTEPTDKEVSSITGEQTDNATMAKSSSPCFVDKPQEKAAKADSYSDRIVHLIWGKTSNTVAAATETPKPRR
jgi:hypothetical protein